MYYLVYKTTNLLNGRKYIGVHQCSHLDDDYYGSGTAIKRALKKYGKQNFKREILHIFNTKEEMLEAERNLVNEEWIKDHNSYNIRIGGDGYEGSGFSFINENGLNNKNNQNIKGSQTHQNLLKTNSEYRKWYSERLKERWYEKGAPWTGRSHSYETKQKMSAIKLGKNTGQLNSQYGSMWITDGIVNRKVKKNTELPKGFRKGRV